MKIKKIVKYIFNREYRFMINSYYTKMYKSVSDSQYLKKMYKIKFHKDLNLENPITFNEKLQWLKLNDRKDIYTTMVDKYKVKDYVASIIGDEYIIPTIGVYNSYDEIDFSKLPEKFVLKPNHTSGDVYICGDKNKINHKKLKKKCKKWLKRDYYLIHREWPYKNVERKLVIEKYMEDKKDKELRDYKFFCFNGKMKYLFIATNRQGEGDTYFDFFDEKFNHLDITNGHPNAPTIPHKPHNYDKMIELASKLSQNIPHVRVDFYEVNKKIYFGEMTFYHWSGYVPFEPNGWDYEFGKFIKLPKIGEKDEK